MVYDLLGTTLNEILGNRIPAMVATLAASFAQLKAVYRLVRHFYYLLSLPILGYGLVATLAS